MRNAIAFSREFHVENTFKALRGKAVSFGLLRRTDYLRLETIEVYPNGLHRSSGHMKGSEATSTCACLIGCSGLEGTDFVHGFQEDAHCL